MLSLRFTGEVGLTPEAAYELNGYLFSQASQQQSWFGKASDQVILVFLLFLLYLIIRLHLIPNNAWKPVPQLPLLLRLLFHFWRWVSFPFRLLPFLGRLELCLYRIEERIECVGYARLQ